MSIRIPTPAEGYVFLDTLRTLLLAGHREAEADACATVQDTVWAEMHEAYREELRANLPIERAEPRK